MRMLGLLLFLGILLQCSGCVVVAVASAASAVAIATVKATGKVAVATVSTTGRVAAAAVTSSGEVTAVSLESATKLTRAGMVVLVDAGTGAVAELPWREGLQLHAATQLGQLRSGFNAAKIFREGRIISASRKKLQAGAPDLLLRAGDVVELKP